MPIHLLNGTIGHTACGTEAERNGRPQLRAYINPSLSWITPANLAFVRINMLNLLIPMTLAALATAGAAQAASSLESIFGNSSIDVIVPGDSGYYNASLAFNRRLHFEPSAIAYPNSTEDVAWLIKNLGEPKGIPGKLPTRCA